MKKKQEIKGKTSKGTALSREKQELMELSHEEVPGYRQAFYIVFAAASLYLAVILLMS